MLSESSQEWFQTGNNQGSLETDQSEQKRVPAWIPAEQALTFPPLDHRKISGRVAKRVHCSGFSRGTEVIGGTETERD